MLKENITVSQEVISTSKRHWYTNDQLFLSQHHFYKRVTQKRLKFILDCVHGYIKKAGKNNNGIIEVLDAGCGDGVVLNTLSLKKELRVVGCESNFLRALRAQKYSRQAHIINGDLKKTPFKSGSFHIIILNQVLEHIKDDDTVLAELRRVVKDRGILVLGVPNEGCFLARLRNKYIQPWIQSHTDHAHFYTEEKIRDKITRSGFKILSLRRDGFMFPHTKIADLLSSFSLGFIFLHALGKVFKAQCGGLYFVCLKN